jgi:hypothetical protein
MMKKRITFDEWRELPIEWQVNISQYFINNYEEPKTELEIGDILDLIRHYGFDYTEDEYKIEEWYNNAIILPEVAIGWDGEELIDILWYRFKEILKKQQL